MTRRDFDRAYAAMVLTVVLPLGILGLVKADQQGNGLPAGATIQSGTVVTEHQPGNFNDNVRIDTTEVSAR